MFKDYLLCEEDGITLAYGSDGIEYHEVEKDETLRDIARQHYGDADLWEIIMRQNGLTNPNELTEGITLEIPLL